MMRTSPPRRPALVTASATVLSNRGEPSRVVAHLAPADSGGCGRAVARDLTVRWSEPLGEELLREKPEHRALQRPGAVVGVSGVGEVVLLQGVEGEVVGFVLVGFRLEDRPGRATVQTLVAVSRDRPELLVVVIPRELHQLLLAVEVDLGDNGLDVVGLGLPRPPAERVVGLDDLAALFAAAGTARTETMLRAAGEAGLRRVEIIGLRWPDVDLAARHVELRRQVVQELLPEGGGHRKVESATKGGRARRVALSGVFAERLADWYAESVVESGADALGYVWPGRGGGPMHNGWLGQAVERACIRAGLVDGEGRALVSPHRLRHSAASVMLAQRVPLTVVAAQLGHANPAITASVYAHLVDDRDLDLAAGAFEGPSVTRTMGGPWGRSGRRREPRWVKRSRPGYVPPHTREVTGSIPVLPITELPAISGYLHPDPCSRPRERRRCRRGLPPLRPLALGWSGACTTT